MMIVNAFEIICKRGAEKGATRPRYRRRVLFLINYLVASAMSLEVRPCILKLKA